MAATRAKKEAHEKPAPARRGKSQAAAAQLLTKLVAQVDGLSAEMRTLKMDLESMHAQLQAVQSGAPVAPRVALSDAAAEPLPVSDLQAELAEAIESGELDEMADEPLPVAEYTTEPEDVYPKVEAEGLEDPEKGPRLPPSENDRMMMSEDDIKSLLAEATDATPEAAGAAVGPVDALFEGLELVEAEGLGDAAPVAAESGSAPVLAAAWRACRLRRTGRGWTRTDAAGLVPGRAGRGPGRRDRLCRARACRRVGGDQAHRGVRRRHSGRDGQSHRDRRLPGVAVRARFGREARLAAGRGSGPAAGRLTFAGT
jgi:hypothetical protein